MERYTRPNELCHYGVLGMKWGKRRFNANYKKAKKYYNAAKVEAIANNVHNLGYYQSSYGSTLYKKARKAEKRANRYKAKLARDGIRTKSMKEISALSKQAGALYVKKNAKERARDIAIRSVLVLSPIPASTIAPSVTTKYKMNRNVTIITR